MAEKSFTYLSSDNKNKISAKIWINEDVKNVAVLQIAHGMVEHKGRYEGFAKWLSDNGIIVCANDHLGHGDSVSCEEDRGFVDGKDAGAFLIEDMNTLKTQIHDAYPELPYFILGHSMGSFMVRRFLTKYSDDLAGAIIMGTGYNAPAAADFGVTITRLFALFKGWRYRSRFVQNLTKNKCHKHLDTTDTDISNSWLTRDPEVVKKYREDPKSGFLFTLAGHKMLFESVAFTSRETNIKAIPKEMPLLVISGGDDPVGMCGERVKLFTDKLVKTGHTKVTLKLYDDDRHEILNELNKDEVYADILNWIKGNVK